jgi:hypothetical protein
MSLIDKTYFVQEINIPDSTYSDLTAYITKYEKEVLLRLLGYDIWKLVNAYSVSTSPQRIKDLVEGKEYTVGDYTVKWDGLSNTNKVSLIAYYVYYFYVRNKSVILQTTGAMQSTGENVKNASPVMSVTEAWNRLEELYGYPGQYALEPSAYNFLMTYQSTYPEWVFEEIGNVNSFDL